MRADSSSPSTLPPIAAPRSPSLLDGFVQLLGRQIRMLQRDRRQPDEAIRMRRTPGRQFFVLQRDDLAGQVAIRPVPPRVDADRLNIDALLVHVPQTLGSQDEIPAAEQVLEGARERRVLDDVLDLRNEAVTVHVHHLDATPPDGDLAAPHRTAGLRNKDQPRRSARDVFEEFPASGHLSSFRSAMVTFPGRVGDLGRRIPRTDSPDDRITSFADPPAHCMSHRRQMKRLPRVHPTADGVLYCAA